MKMEALICIDISSGIGDTIQRHPATRSNGKLYDQTCREHVHILWGTMAQWKGSMSCVRGSQVLIPLWPTRTDPAWESLSLAIAYRDVVAWWYVLFLVTRGSDSTLPQAAAYTATLYKL